jgi:hypothetical protein
LEILGRALELVADGKLPGDAKYLDTLMDTIKQHRDA